jgi:hypothetical protein
MALTRPKANQDIREKLKIQGVYLWEIAEKLHITECTMTRWMRKELPESKKQLILDTADEIHEEKYSEE